MPNGVAVDNQLEVIRRRDFQPGAGRGVAKKNLFPKIGDRPDLRRFYPLGIAEVELILSFFWSEISLNNEVSEHEPTGRDQGP